MKNNAKVLRYIIVLLTAILSLFIVSCENEVHYSYEVNESGEAVITEAKTSMNGIFSPFAIANIPESIDGYPVVEIGESAFEDTWIGEVTIPHSVKRIGRFAFYNCFWLTGVHIPASVEFMEGSSFLNCDDNFDLTVDEWNTFYKIIDGNLYSHNGDRLVWYMGSQSSFTVPSSVNVIGPYAFSDTSLDYIKVPENVVSIEEYGFSMSDASHIELSEGLISIGDGAFEEGSIFSINIPASVSSIGKNAFKLRGAVTFTVAEGNQICKALDGSLISADGKIFIKYGSNNGEDEYRIPDGVETIGSFAFYDADPIESLIIPDSVKYIEDGAFYSCDGICEIAIPEGVESLGAECFRGCNYLQVAYLPSTLTSVVTDLYSGSFEYCDALEKIEISKDNPAFKSVSGVVFTKDGKTLLHYPIGKRGIYIVPDGTEIIGAGAFYDADDLRGVSFPNTLKRIEEKAFYWTGMTRNLNIPDSVEYIGESAFAYAKFDKVTIGAGVKEIGPLAFVSYTNEGVSLAVFKDPEGWRAIDDDTGEEKAFKSFFLGFEIIAADRLSGDYCTHRWIKE
jgi:hypothetical protein